MTTLVPGTRNRDQKWESGRPARPLVVVGDVVDLVVEVLVAVVEDEDEGEEEGAGSGRKATKTGYWKMERAREADEVQRGSSKAG